MRKNRILCLCGVVVLLIALLVGCGAEVSTVMNISTENGSFEGSRDIELLIDNDDLSSVTGGMTGLETVLTENLPADLTYVISYPSETQSKITFTLTFSSLEDYTTKITNLLNANAENTIVPEIVFQQSKTLFREGLEFTENFQSFDLIRWYFNALITADIISESSSNWYELASDTLIVDGVTLDTYGHKFDYDEVQERFLDDCSVETVMNTNGTFDRTITFQASEYTLEKLEAANDITDDFDTYMKNLAPEGVTYTSGKEEDSSYTSYVYTMTGLTADEIAAKTNLIMQSENNSFSVTVQPKEGVAGTAVLTIEETLDASYYLDAQWDTVYSHITTFPNFTLSGDNSGVWHYDEGVYYYANTNEKRTITGDWQVSFDRVALELGASGSDKLNADLTFTVNEALAADIQDIAFSALENACKDNASFSRDGNSATCSFSGNAEDLANKFNAFVSAYAPSQDDSEYIYCSVSLEEMNTASKLTDGIYGSFDLDLQRVTGDMQVIVSGDRATDIVTPLSENEQGELYTDTYISIQFCTVKTNWLTTILLILFALLILGGIAWGVVNRAGFVEWFVLIKEKAKKKPAAEAVAGAVSTPDPVAVPCPDAPAPAAEAAQSNEEAEEEEELL